jgi:hypothetical protein
MAKLWLPKHLDEQRSEAVANLRKTLEYAETRYTPAVDHPTKGSFFREQLKRIRQVRDAITASDAEMAAAAMLYFVAQNLVEDPSRRRGLRVQPKKASAAATAKSQKHDQEWIARANYVGRGKTLTQYVAAINEYEQSKNRESVTRWLVAAFLDRCLPGFRVKRRSPRVEWRSAGVRIF